MAGKNYAIQIVLRARNLASQVVSQAVTGFVRSLKGLGGAVKGIGSGIRGAFAFGADLKQSFEGIYNIASKIVSTMANLVNSTSEATGDIADLSERTGVSTSAIQELQFAMSGAGVSAEDLASGIDTANKNLGQMAAGKGRMLSFLQAANLQPFIKQLKDAKTGTERLDLMVASLGKVKDEAQRDALGEAMFGEAGKKIAASMAGGAEAMRAAREEAHKVGFVMDSELVQGAAAAGDKFDKLKLGLEGVKRTFGAEILVASKPAVQELLEWMMANKAEIHGFAKDFATGVVDAARGIVDAFKWIYEHREAILDWAKALAITLGLIKFGGWANDIKNLVTGAGGAAAAAAGGGGAAAGGGGAAAGGWLGRLPGIGLFAASAQQLWSSFFGDPEDGALAWVHRGLQSTGVEGAVQSFMWNGPSGGRRSPAEQRKIDRDQAQIAAEKARYDALPDSAKGALADVALSFDRLMGTNKTGQGPFLSTLSIPEIVAQAQSANLGMGLDWKFGGDRSGPQKLEVTIKTEAGTTATVTKAPAGVTTKTQRNTGTATIGSGIR